MVASITQESDESETDNVMLKESRERGRPADAETARYRERA